MKTDAELIEDFIAKYGVTQCPPAVCAPTQGVDVSADAAAAHIARADGKKATKNHRYTPALGLRNEITRRQKISSKRRRLGRENRAARGAA
ncbi:MAG: hypothetical protein RIB80_04725 [Rhodospirillales bacterium]